MSAIIGIAVDDLPSTSPVCGQHDDYQPPSPISSDVPDLPTTPPRPLPPPKDLPVILSPTNIRLSRSMENFSRPTRSLAIAGDISPISEMDSEDVWTAGPFLPTAPPSPLSWAEATNDTLTSVSSSRRQSQSFDSNLDKPLPLPPALPHAVSTVEESAMPLTTEMPPQLPDIPVGSFDEVFNSSATFSSPDHTGAASPRNSLRHMQTFPSAKAARRRSQSSGEMTLGNSISAISLMSPAITFRPKHARQPSIGIKKIDIEDWDDAIDYSWDHPLDVEDASNADFKVLESVNTAIARAPAPPANIQAYSNRPMPLTPVMEQQHEDHAADSLQSPTRGYADNAAASLRGLGIDALRPITVVQVDNDAYTVDESKRESSRISAIQRDAGSTISKSSSQESIILSIASSIMGTQRSSNSSTNLSDMSPFTSFGSEPESAPQKEIRRAESREGDASDTSQDTVTTEPRSLSTPATKACSPAASPAAKHERGFSTSQVNVPDRSSSIAASRPPAGTRQRSSTLNSGRPKNRVSYSLFPASKPAVPSI